MNQIVFNRIADEMTQIFSVSRESLDPQANLFELGLDSLMLIKLGQRLAEFGDLFSNPEK